MASMLVPKSAGRTPIACTNCAKTKTKCDKKFPCSRCASRNLKCILRPTRRVSRQASTSQSSPIKVPEADCCSSASSDSSQHSHIATPEDLKSGSPRPQLQLALPVLDTSPQLDPVSALDQISTSQSEKSFNLPQPQSAPQKPVMFFPPSVSSNQSSQSMQAGLSPMPSPGTIVNGFMSTTPISSYEEFALHPSDASDQSSPRFMMDWGQLQLASQMNTMGRPDLSMSMGMNIDSLTTDASMLAIMPDFAQSMASLQTPMTTPRLSMCGSTPDMDMRHGSMTMPTVARHDPMSEDMGFADLPAVIQGQAGWNCFRSAPVVPSSAVPKTASLYIEKLEQSLKNHELWSSWALAWQNQDTSADHLAVLPLQECAKDKLLAITQSFLHRAIETHRGTSHMVPEMNGMSSYFYGSNFILLPPAQVLSYFLRSYANTFERYFPLSPCGVLDVNQRLMDHRGNDRAASLLTLMMIAAGALYVPSMDARWLNGGLIEACRLSLFESIETNIAMASNPTVLHAALLLTTTAAWSGDKWHMNIAMGQRGMYTSMLRHSGALEPQNMGPPAPCSSEQLHADWQQKESTSRLVYSWVMLDQDVALFHDAPPLFSITELGAPLPDSDRLWHAKTTAEWTTVFGQVHEFSGGFSAAASGVRPVSLRSLFRHFMEDDIIPRGMELTPLHLRLLLHPLQALVCQYRQLTSCFSDNVSPRQQANNVHTQSMRARAEELQVLLKRWRRLADRYASSHPMCPLMQANMVVLHLISLNTVTNFGEIEKLARKEDFDGSFAQLMWKHKRCITDIEEAVYHCGQVIRLIKGMPANVRPPWWAGAVYRVSLILWTRSLAHPEDQASNAATAAANASSNGMFSPKEQYIGIDAYTAEHPVLSRFRTKKEGRPALTRRDSSLVPIENGIAILSHCLEVIDEGVANRFSDGIRNKLEQLARGL